MNRPIGSTANQRTSSVACSEVSTSGCAGSFGDGSRSDSQSSSTQPSDGSLSEISDPESLVTARPRAVALFGDLIGGDLQTQPQHRHRGKAKPVLKLACLRQGLLVQTLLSGDQHPDIPRDGSGPALPFPRDRLRRMPQLGPQPRLSITRIDLERPGRRTAAAALSRQLQCVCHRRVPPPTLTLRLRDRVARSSHVNAPRTYTRRGGYRGGEAGRSERTSTRGVSVE